MAKRSTEKKDAAPVKRDRYTVNYRYQKPLRGSAVGGSIEINAAGKAKAKAAALVHIGKELERIDPGNSAEVTTIIKGCQPMNIVATSTTERHHRELQAIHGAHSVYTSLSWQHPDYRIGPIDPDTDARQSWERFLVNGSHGLAISDFPRYVVPEARPGTILQFAPVNVRDPEHWPWNTEAMQEWLQYQKDYSKEHAAYHKRTGDKEDAKWHSARLKELEAMEGMTFEQYVESMLPGLKPDPLDLDNPRIYAWPSGKWIPIANLGTGQLRGDFWRRLLEIWERPVNLRAEEVRAFLDHHHMKGGKPEAFRDLVNDTAKRLHDAAKRTAQSHLARKLELLGDKLREWHTSASTANSLIQHRAEVLTPAGSRAFIRSLIAEGGKLETRATKVDALLNGHLGRDYSEAFVEFIRGNVLEWKAEAASHRPPPDPLHQFAILRGFARGWLRVDPWLIDRCERWLAEVDASKDERKKAPASNPSKWPDLKSLALFHAYRYEAGDKGADLGTMDAAEVAAQAGYTGKGNGKRLLAYFTKYSTGSNRANERTMEGKRPADVRKRFAEVCERLKPYSKALELAEVERKKLTNRDYQSED